MTKASLSPYGFVCEPWGHSPRLLCLSPETSHFQLFRYHDPPRRCCLSSGLQTQYSIEFFLYRYSHGHPPPTHVAQHPRSVQMLGERVL